MFRFFKKKKHQIEPENHAGYPGFEYTAKELSAFGTVDNKFIISLKNEKVVYHTPDDVQAIYTWLIENNIREVKGISK